MKRSIAFFKSLAARERILAMNQPLASLLGSALKEVGSIADLTSLQRHYLITEIGYVYQHFGFSVFGPKARQFLAANLGECSGVKENVLQAWLETIAFMLLEDFNILKIVTGEPDWEAVDKVFFKDFARRILCAESMENTDFGLEIWDEKLVQSLCNRSVKWIAMVQTDDVSKVIPEINWTLESQKFSAQLSQALIENLEIVAKNVLQILIWRIQFLTSFADIRQEAKFIIRGHSMEQELKATKLAALLAMFLPHEAPNGDQLLPPSPLTATQLASILKVHANPTPTSFDCSLFKNWLDLDEKNVQRELVALIQDAYKTGLLFEVPHGKHIKKYGATLGALQILMPFHKMITKLLLKPSHSMENESLEDSMFCEVS